MVEKVRVVGQADFFGPPAAGRRVLRRHLDGPLVVGELDLLRAAM